MWRVSTPVERSDVGSSPIKIVPQQLELSPPAGGERRVSVAIHSHLVASRQQNRTGPALCASCYSNTVQSKEMLQECEADLTLGDLTPTAVREKEWETLKEGMFEAERRHLSFLLLALIASFFPPRTVLPAHSSPNIWTEHLSPLLSCLTFLLPSFGTLLSQRFSLLHPSLSQSPSHSLHPPSFSLQATAVEHGAQC